MLGRAIKDELHLETEIRIVAEFPVGGFAVRKKPITAEPVANAFAENFITPVYVNLISLQQAVITEIFVSSTISRVIVRPDKSWVRQ
jgi:hypothetical protein